MTCDPLIQELSQEYARWCQKKRPATPQFRAELLAIAREQRSEGYDAYARADGQPLTAEDRLHIRRARRGGYQAGRAYLLTVENEIEAKFWQLLAEFGIYPEGGKQ